MQIFTTANYHYCWPHSLPKAGMVVIHGWAGVPFVVEGKCGKAKFPSRNSLLSYGLWPTQHSINHGLISTLLWWIFPNLASDPIPSVGCLNKWANNVRCVTFVNHSTGKPIPVESRLHISWPIRRIVGKVTEALGGDGMANPFLP